MTRNNNTGYFVFCNWNEWEINIPISINWRASLVPAAAVIPAPIAYIKVVAVKKLVAELVQHRGNVFEMFTTDEQKRPNLLRLGRRYFE